MHLGVYGVVFGHGAGGMELHFAGDKSAELEGGTH